MSHNLIQFALGSLTEKADKYLGIGLKMFVQGRVMPTKYGKNGKSEYGLDCIVENIQYLAQKK